VPGQTGKGGRDAPARKLKPNGATSWTRQVRDRCWRHHPGADFDRKARLVIAGRTGGTFPGESASGASDAFIRVHR
jgi:hypothetical protein